MPLSAGCASFQDIISPLSTWAPQQSRGARWKQFPGTFGEALGEWKRLKLARIPQPVELCGTFSNAFGGGWARDSASKYNTCKTRVDQEDQVITLGVQTDCEKSSTPPRIQSFHKHCEKASSDLCSISADPGRQFAFTCSAYHHTERPSAALRCCSVLSPLSNT